MRPPTERFDRRSARAAGYPRACDARAFGVCGFCGLARRAFAAGRLRGVAPPWRAVALRPRGVAPESAPAAFEALRLRGAALRLRGVFVVVANARAGRRGARSWRCIVAALSNNSFAARPRFGMECVTWQLLAPENKNFAFPKWGAFVK